MLQSSGFPILSDCQPKLARSRIQRFPVQRPLTPTRDLSQFAAFFIGVWNRAIHLLASYLNPFFALLNPISLAFAGIIDQNDLKDSCEHLFLILASKGVLHTFIVCNPYTTKHLVMRILFFFYRHLPLEFSSLSLNFEPIHAVDLTW